MATNECQGIAFDDAGRQGELERLIAVVAEAERERDPVGRRHRQAERDLEDGDISDDDFRALDDQYIAANNKIAAAKRDVDAFLAEHRDFKTR